MAPKQPTGILFFSIRHIIGLVFTFIKEHVGDMKENQHFNSTETQQQRGTHAEPHMQREEEHNLNPVTARGAAC